jgi:hypothetical protein
MDGRAANKIVVGLLVEGDVQSDGIFFFKG